MITSDSKVYYALRHRHGEGSPWHGGYKQKGSQVQVERKGLGLVLGIYMQGWSAHTGFLNNVGRGLISSGPFQLGRRGVGDFKGQDRVLCTALIKVSEVSKAGAYYDFHPGPMHEDLAECHFTGTDPLHPTLSLCSSQVESHYSSSTAHTSLRIWIHPGSGSNADSASVCPSWNTEAAFLTSFQVTSMPMPYELQWTYSLQHCPRVTGLSQMKNL